MKINSRAKQFCKLATLLSDMAHRTMFGLTDSNRNPDHFDFIAARLSANGAKDLIQYGAHVVEKELEHFHGKLPITLRTSALFEQKKPIPTIDNLQTYILFFHWTTKSFNDTGSWTEGFGGPKWGKISDTLEKISIFYKKYLNAEKYSNDEKNAITNLLIQMNIFDGLSHNSETIYRKLLIQEARENRIFDFNQDSDVEFQRADEQLEKIFRIRDISESEHSPLVLRELEKYIKTLPYEDITTQLRSHPEYSINAENKVEEEILIISTRRQIKENIDYKLEFCKSRLIRCRNETNKIKDVLSVPVTIDIKRNNLLIPAQYWASSFFSISSSLSHVSNISSIARNVDNIYPKLVGQINTTLVDIVSNIDKNSPKRDIISNFRKAFDIAISKNLKTSFNELALKLVEIMEKSMVMIEEQLSKLEKIKYII